MKHPFGPLRAIESPDESFEAAGFVMDCILADSSVDASLGERAGLRPIEMVRGANGEILCVVCSVRPCDSTGLLGQPSEIESRFLITAPVSA